MPLNDAAAAKKTMTKKKTKKTKKRVSYTNSLEACVIRADEKNVLRIYSNIRVGCWRSDYSL